MVNVHVLEIKIDIHAKDVSAEVESEMEHWVPMAYLGVRP